MSDIDSWFSLGSISGREGLAIRDFDHEWPNHSP